MHTDTRVREYTYTHAHTCIYQNNILVLFNLQNPHVQFLCLEDMILTLFVLSFLNSRVTGFFSLGKAISQKKKNSEIKLAVLPL